jgi:hypothetical protein
MQETKATAQKLFDKRRNERGSAIIVAVMFMAILIVISLAAAKVRVASAHDIDSHETQQKDYWGARSGAAVIEASIRSDLPTRFTSDLQNAKYQAGGQALPAFDSRNISQSQSRPVVDSNGYRTSYPLNSCTSLLGQVDDWAQSRISIPESYASNLGYTGRVAALREAYRQQMASSVPTNEPAYVLEFYIDAAAGENGHVRPSGTLMLGPAVIGCNTTVTLDTSPSTIIQGSSSSLIVTYSNANRIVVTDAAGSTIADQSVTESSATQSLTIPVTPPSTTTYTAVATSAGGCSATSAPKTLTVNIPPPQIVSFSANPNCIIQGENSTLTWTITGATAATINGAPVNPSSGTLVVTPSATTTYTLVATNSSGSVQAQVVVSVTIPPRVNLFSASPSCMMPGSGSVLQWNISDAVSVTINGTPVNPAGGTMNVNPGSDTVYTIVATGAGCNAQTVQAQTTVQVATIPTINLFSASPNSYIVGGSSVLQWNISGAVSATINGTPVNPSSGTMTVSPSATTTYTIVATSGGCSPQQAQAQVTVTVDPKPPDPVVCPTINTFNAAQSCLLPGQSTSLQWDVTNAESVTINGTPVNPASGSIPITPSATTTYTLVASKTGCAPQQATVVVQVGSVPTINSFTAASGTVQQGNSTSLSWDVSNAATVTIDGISVNPASGSIPVTPAGTHTYTLIATSGGCSPQQTQAQVTVNVTACPSIAYFTASPLSILQGGSAILQWSASNASAVTLNGSPVPATGSMTVTPATTTTYRLLAQSASGGCDVESFATVTVGACAAPQVVSFTANPNTVDQGGNVLVRLAWSVNETTGTGTTVTISPGIGSFNGANGFVDITQPQATTTYTIIATNGCGATSAPQQVTVTVNPPSCPEFHSAPGLTAGAPGCPNVEIVSFTGSVEDVYWYDLGGITPFVPYNWYTRNATNVTVNGIPMPTTGSYQVTSLMAPGPGEYPVTIEAWNACNPAGVQRITKKLRIHAANFPGIGVTLTPSIANPGDSVRVDWTSTGDSVDITGVGSGLPPSGTTTIIAPATTTTYTATSYGYGGANSRSVALAIATEGPIPGWFISSTFSGGSVSGPTTARVAMRENPDGSVEITPSLDYFSLLGPPTRQFIVTLYKGGVAYWSGYVYDMPAFSQNHIPPPDASLGIPSCGKIDMIVTVIYKEGDPFGGFGGAGTSTIITMDTHHGNGYVQPQPQDTTSSSHYEGTPNCIQTAGGWDCSGSSAGLVPGQGVQRFSDYTSSLWSLYSNPTFQVGYLPVCPSCLR